MSRMDLLMKICKCVRYIASKMKQYSHLIGLVMTFIMILLRFIPTDNESLETRPMKPPKPIASNGSKVFDVWRGSLLFRDILLGESEIAMVYYYAPWSADSIDGMKEFEAASEVMYKQVTFIAVNCWWIHGECRGQFQFSKYPQIYVHHRNLRDSILYNDPLQKEYLIHFLKKVMIPLEYLGTKSKVENFLEENQFTVLAWFPPSVIDFSKAWKNYSAIALKQLEYNRFPVYFGIVTSEKISKSYSLKQDVLQIRNCVKRREVLVLNLKSSIQKILRRLVKFSFEMISPDLQFPGTKTNFMHQIIKRGPTLVVFISSESIEKREKYVRRVRKLAILYNDCREKEKNDHFLSSAIYANSTSENSRCCKSVIFDNDDTPSLVCSVCVTQQEEVTHQKYAFCDLIENFVSDVDYDPDNWVNTAQNAVSQNFDATPCASILLTYNTQYAHLDVCCKEKESYLDDFARSMNRKNQDDWVDEILSKTRQFSNWVDKNETTISDTSAIAKSVVFADDESVINGSDNIITGFACKTNRTLQFFTLDFDKHAALSENFGVDANVYHDNGLKMGAVIFDPSNERRHVMASSHFHLENFITNYTLGILPSNHRSSHDIDAGCLQNPCIAEITSKTFHEQVLNSDKDVLLFYYTSWCISCTSISHVYLSLADLLQPVSAVLLARINAQTNELPLPFTVQSYPTLILYPAHQSIDSSVFPKDAEISVPSLLSFIFKHISRESLKQILLKLCSHGTDYPNIQHIACKKWKSFRRL